MNRTILLGMLALGALAAGCGTDYSGSYKGDATESGSLKIATLQTGDKATNESPPRKVADTTVTVTKSGGAYSVKFGNCELKGEASTPDMLVVKNDCDVKVANWEGKLPLSATVKFNEGNALSMEVKGTTKNDTTVVEYVWTFNGKK